MKTLALILALGFVSMPAFADNGICINNHLKRLGGGYARANRLLVEKITAAEAFRSHADLSVSIK